MRRQMMAIAFLLGSAMPALAHHGWGSYAAETPLQLNGTVKSIAFENPHGHLVLETPQKQWDVVLSPPTRMINRGLTQEQIKIGSTVEVMGYPHRSTTTEMRAEWIKVDGTTTQLR